MLEHESDLAAIITAESGKPLAEARGEVKYGASYLGWFAEEAPRMDGWVMQSPIKGRRMMAIKQPLG